jgi:hypothetical protein
MEVLRVQKNGRDHRHELLTDNVRQSHLSGQQRMQGRERVVLRQCGRVTINLPCAWTPINRDNDFVHDRITDCGEPSSHVAELAEEGSRERGERERGDRPQKEILFLSVSRRRHFAQLKV